MKFSQAFNFITAACLFAIICAEERVSNGGKINHNSDSSSSTITAHSTPRHLEDNKKTTSDLMSSTTPLLKNHLSPDGSVISEIVVPDPSHRQLQANIWSLDLSNYGGSPNEWYGGSVAISEAGDRFVTGAYGYVPPGSGQTNAGKVEVYFLINGSWTLVKEWVGNDRDQLGRKVSISDDGKRIAATIPGDNSGSMSNFDGRVIVWEETNGSWAQVGEKAFAPNASSVALSGDGKRFVAGSSKASHPYNRVARVYEEVNSVWIQLVEIAGKTTEESFAINGVGMSYDGKQFIGGAPYTSSNDPNNIEGAGARVYREDTSGGWMQVGPDISSWTGGGLYPHNAFYGYCADISNDGKRVVVGEPGRKHIEVWQLNGSNYQQFHTLSNLQAYRFGYSCTISQDGNTFAAGSTSNNFGTVVFDMREPHQVYIKLFGPESPGDAVAISGDGNTVAIGNNFVDNFTGRVAIYSKPACNDSKLAIQLDTTGGSTVPYLCKQAAKNFGFTSCSQALSTHCIRTCGKCNENLCSDSVGNFIFKGQLRDCTWLAAKEQTKREQLCQNKKNLAQTCRATCKICD